MDAKLEGGRRMGLAAVAALMFGCAAPPELGRAGLASTVADHETSTCSTAVVLELARQIAGEVDCLGPGQLVPFAEGGGIVFTGGAILPYVSTEARDDLLAAVQSTGGQRLELTSAYRTLPQQYLLHRWWQLGRCGITAAATPGNSNHESGRAIDVGNHGAWAGVLPGFGWTQTVPGDDVHFDHLASPDLRGTDVEAFQRLWNRNRPGDVIDEDARYGPITEARLRMAPAEGFAQGPACAPAGLAMTVDRIDAPRVLAPGARATITLSLRNTGPGAWPAGTALVTSEPAGRASVLVDPATWPAPDRAAVLVAPVAPGAVTALEVVIVAPETAPLELTETFALDAGGRRFGALALVLTVDDTAGTTGGCAAGDAQAPAPLFLLALALGLRRRAGARVRASVRE